MLRLIMLLPCSVGAAATRPTCSCTRVPAPLPCTHTLLPLLPPPYRCATVRCVDSRCPTQNKDVTVMIVDKVSTLKHFILPRMLASFVESCLPS